MLSIPPSLVRLLSVLVFGLVVATATAEDAVTLRPVAVAVGPVIRLADVANLEGLEAAGLGATVLREDATAGSQRVTLADVRVALEAAGANLGRFRLHGVSFCEVDVRAAPAAPISPGPLPPASVDGDAAVAPVVVPAAENPLGERLRHRLAGWLGLDPKDHDSLHLTTEEADAPLLNSAADAARYRIEPLGRPRLGRVSVRIEERDDLGGLTLHTVSVDTERDVEAVVVSSPVRRGDTFSPANVSLETVRLGREPAGSAEPLSSLDGVYGAEAAVTLLPGTRLVAGQLSRPALVRRGGHVTVRVSAGAVELVTEGVAEADAAMGEALTVRLGKTRGSGARTVQATVSGSNQVRVNEF